MARGADIGAVSGGIRGMHAPGVGFFKGALRGTMIGILGGSLSMFGGGTLAANLASGIWQGSLTSGVNHLVWGGDFNSIGSAMMKGALLGAGFAAVSSGIEMGINHHQGYGFKTNEWVMRGMFKDKDYQGLINFIELKYLNSNHNIQYSSASSDLPGQTVAKNGNLKSEIYSGATMSLSKFKETVAHERAHAEYGFFIGSRKGSDGLYHPHAFRRNSKQYYSIKVGGNERLIIDTPEGYQFSVRNAGFLHISRDVSSNILGNYSLWNVMGKRYIPYKFIR